jgi:hypothetical protein
MLIINCFVLFRYLFSLLLLAEQFSYFSTATQEEPFFLSVLTHNSNEHIVYGTVQIKSVAAEIRKTIHLGTHPYTPSYSALYTKNRYKTLLLTREHVHYSYMQSCKVE